MISTALISAISAIATYLVTYLIGRKKTRVSTIDEILQKYEELSLKYINLSEAYSEMKGQIQILQIEVAQRKIRINKLEQQLLDYKQPTTN